MVVVCKDMQEVKQNPPVVNWRFRLTQVDLYNRHKIVVVCVCVVKYAGKIAYEYSINE